MNEMEKYNAEKERIEKEIAMLQAEKRKLIRPDKIANLLTERIYQLGSRNCYVDQHIEGMLRPVGKILIDIMRGGRGRSKPNFEDMTEREKICVADFLSKAYKLFNDSVDRVRALESNAPDDNTD